MKKMDFKFPPFIVKLQFSEMIFLAPFYNSISFVPQVHPHVGESPGLQRPFSGLFRLPADGGAARQTGVLHRHHEDAAAGAHGRTCAEQKPQTHAEEVRNRWIRKFFLYVS